MSAWPGSSSYSFTHALDGGGSATHDVHVKGAGPPILILQELPGIGPETLALADRLIGAGFRVFLPHLLGRFGKVTTGRNFLRLICVRREFDMFRTGAQSPVAGWMRGLCADISAREGGARLGVVGMCLTGSFAIPLMAEDAVAAAVASEPALPLLRTRRLHMSVAEVEAANTAMAQKGHAVAMRYDRDPISTRRHMAALKGAFGDNLRTCEFPSRRLLDHSLLTLDFCEDAYALVERYFRERFGMAEGPRDAHRP